MTAVALLAISAILLRAPIRNAVIAIEMQRVLDSAEVHRVLPVRLRARSDRFVRALAHLAPSSKSTQREAAVLFRLAENKSDAASEALGVAYFLAGRSQLAVESFRAMAQAQGDAASWNNLAAAELNNLAAAELFAASGERGHDCLLSGLADLARALAADPNCAEAKANRSYGLKMLGIDQPGDDAAGWKRLTANFAATRVDDLARGTRRFPQQARTYAEGLYFSSWADAVKAGCPDDAEAILLRIRVIAGALQALNGESLLGEAVVAAEEAVKRRDTRRINMLADAFVLYRQGRMLLPAHHPTDAGVDLTQSRDLFAQAGSPMAEVAECYLAVSLIDQNRATEARQKLKALIASQRDRRTHHFALLALAHYHIALSDASAGNWSESIETAQESLALFQRLGERGQAGMVEALLSQAYEFIGQQRLSWEQTLHAIADTSAAGDHVRERITVAGLSRTELRHGRWHFALAAIDIEKGIAKVVSDPVQDCDMLQRLAAAESHMGQRAQSKNALTTARRTAQSLKDAALRAKVLADIDAVDGSLTRKTDPSQAVSLLSGAITFMRNVNRPLLLPELYLERGRAEMALRSPDSAALDLEEGIRCLEQQRSRMRDIDLRPGIFDRAADLFTEAVSLALQRGDTASAFGYVERSRARAVLEEVAANGDNTWLPPFGIPSAGEIARTLDSDSVIVEYAALDDRLAIFTIDHEGLSVASVLLTRAVLERETRAFTSSLRARRPLSEVEQHAGRLYELLIDPVRGRLSASRNVIFIPDVTLQQTAFAALFDAQSGRFLIEKHGVISAPSAAMYAVSSRRSRQFRGKTPASIAVFANPSLQGGAFDQLPSLPSAEREARALARGYRQRVVAVRTAATAEYFESAAPGAEIVQFGGHAVLNSSEPGRSALLFAAASRDRGPLFLQQIARMHFGKTHIVVLAACKTLRSHDAPVEGVPSLARAFIVAGVPSVIGTLEDVDDLESGKVVIALHKGLRAGMSPVEALQYAQLAALRGKDPALRHPGFWSTFALLGAGG